MKKLLSIILICSLLFSPLKTACAWSFWESVVQAPLKSITQSIDTETMQKLFPLMALVATVVGFYYLMSSKNKGSDEIEKVLSPRTSRTSSSTSSSSSSSGVEVPKLSKTGKVEETELRPEIEQFEVYSQRNSDGGGPASCGYHTLLRAMQVVQSKSRNESEEELVNTLKDPSSIEIYFGISNEVNEWRSEIINTRKLKELKNELHERLMSAFSSGVDEKIESWYSSALGFFEDEILAVIENPHKRGRFYDFSDDAIAEYIQNGLEKLENEDNRDEMEFLGIKSLDMIKNCFDLDKMRKAVLAEDQIVSLLDLVEKVYENPRYRAHFEGDWLVDGEIEFLWKEKNYDFIPRNIACDFKVANINLIHQESDELKTHIRNGLKPGKNFRIFALSEGMKQTSDKERSSGHWYPLVMYQNEQGQRKYYVMDSMNENGYSYHPNRLHDENAQKVINLIENAIKEAQ